jgi:hypothetical protein
LRSIIFTETRKKERRNEKMSNAITTQSITTETTKALILLDSDPKMQKALETYQKLPEKDQNILLLLMDAFAAGVEAAQTKDN